ncbi:MAG: acyl-CoA thioesterase [Bacteroidetes bacterium]|nr:acyl-CoA thioesterase [Bacteroidota bacterium]
MSDKKYLDYEHLVTFSDTNSYGNVYFSKYIDLQGTVREKFLYDNLPGIVEELNSGNFFVTEFAHIDYKNEAILFDTIVVRMTIIDLSRTRIEFQFDYFNKKTNVLLAQGKQAVVWVNAQHRPALMPDELYDKVVGYFGEG